MPALSAKAEAQRLIGRVHPEYRLFCSHWDWLLDSYEGGNRYRDANYGSDSLSYPIRNLNRHKREYAPPDAYGNTPRYNRPLGSDPAHGATDDDYQARLARTPVPDEVRRVVDIHLARIYSREVKRDGPPELASDAGWWADVDGLGTPIDRWMPDVVAPLFGVLGQIDILFDHPPVPEGEDVRSAADVRRLKLSAVRASLILPGNLRYWRVEGQGRYIEAIVSEWPEDANGDVVEHRRIWTAEGSRLYALDGELVEDRPHPYKAVPIVRVFDRRKSRRGWVGQSRYESTADLMRGIYNRESELIVSDTLLAHPILQMPAEILDPPDKGSDSREIPIGPGYILGMVQSATGTGGWQGAQYISPDKSPADSIRTNIDRDRDAIDRTNALTKPAGSGGMGKGTVGQSGVSKQMDQADGNNLLRSIARSTEHLEVCMARMAMLVARDGKADIDPASIKIAYPGSFNLFGPAEQAEAFAAFEGLMDTAKGLPDVEGPVLKDLYRKLMPGLDDSDYVLSDQGIDDYLADRSADRDRSAEAMAAMTPGPTGGFPPAADDASADNPQDNL